MLPTVFNFEGQGLAVFNIDGEPWFLAKEICSVLEISNSRDAVSRLNENMKRAVGTPDAIGRTQQTTIVSEAGVYKLVFTSRKPEAEKFTDWLAIEVIPSIRKTGTYSVQLSPTEALLKSVQLLAEQERQLKEISQAQAQQSQQLNVLTERVTNLDLLDIDGDLQQRLNSMIRKLARDRGISYSAAWSEFIQDYNTAYHTNLKLAKKNFEEKCCKSFTTPGYLNEIGKLEDAVRVADKMLNQRVG